MVNTIMSTCTWPEQYNGYCSEQAVQYIQQNSYILFQSWMTYEQPHALIMNDRYWLLFSVLISLQNTCNMHYITHSCLSFVILPDLS